MELDSRRFLAGGIESRGTSICEASGISSHNGCSRLAFSQQTRRKNRNIQLKMDVAAAASAQWPDDALSSWKAGSEVVAMQQQPVARGGLAPFFFWRMRIC
ncbi:unnamed protein product [Urochloa humidicola]